MKEKIGSWLLLFLSVAPFLIAAVGIQFMPDQIPVHYGINGNIDRWGSKYEEFILAVTFSLSGWILWLVARFSHCFADTDEERAKAKANAKLVIVIGIVVQLFLCVVQIAIMLGAMHEVSVGATASVMPIYKIIGIGLGVMFIVIGNIMPKAKPNSLVGVRTHWSQSSPEAWTESQRLGGISYVAGGALCVVLSIALHGFAIFWVIMGCTLGASALAVWFSFRASR